MVVVMSAIAGRKLQEYSRTAEQTARDALVVAHLWLVRHLIGKIAARLPSGVDVENLESAGILGLVEASQRFDATRGVDFKAFASLRIRGAIIDDARRNCPLPQDLMRRVSLVMKAHDRLPAPVTTEDLVRETGLSADEVLDALVARPFVHVHSLEQLEVDPEKSASADEQRMEHDEQKQLLAEAIAALPERERLVVTLYYMEDLRLKEIGQVLNLSESRVSRLLASAQLQLREYVMAKEE
jgi:RNA polymerase sigma factor for flagellar operon FliA